MAMDFFEHQDAARRKTGRLVVLFALAVVCIVLVIYLAVAYLFANFAPKDIVQSPDWSFWDPRLFLAVSGATVAVIGLGSLFKTFELRGGGESVALMLGGRLLDAQSAGPAERRLLNVVEEMALASGTPVPPVYVMDREDAINAFAAGYAPGDAVIGVTRGTLETLDRDELQGVIAHEFSHIFNGDMRLNMRLIGLLHGILILSIIGYYLTRNAFLAGNSRRKGGALPVLAVGAVLLIVGSVGVFFGKLIKAAVSRQREFLADAAAVQFTRNPEGIAGALKKIGGMLHQSRIEDAHAEEASHLFFGDAFGNSPLNLLSTHPPLAERVRRIDPSFDGKFPRTRPTASGDMGAGTASAFVGPAVSAPQSDRSQAEIQMLRGRARARRLNPTAAVASVGMPGADSLRHARSLLSEIPTELERAAHEPYGARAVVYALLLDDEPGVREKQLQALAAQAAEQSYRETLRLADEVAALGEEFRLPLIDIALPALKSLSARQYATFRAVVELLVNADNGVALWEYVLWIVVVRHLDVHFEHSQPPRVRYRAVSAVADSAALVVGMFAHVGNTELASVEAAFALGAAMLGRGIPLPSRQQCTLGALDEALKQLAQASAGVKRRVVEACAACVAADGQTTIRERELLRAVAEMIHCPIPPLSGEEE